MTTNARVLTRPVTPAIAIACALVARAAAAEEAIHFAYDAPPSCATAEQVRAYVTAYGGHFRDAREEEAARAFTITIAEDALYRGRFVVRDAAGEETAREITSERCEVVTRSIALFVALALETPAAPIVRAPEPRFSDDASREPNAHARRPGRQGSGGAFVTAYHGGVFLTQGSSGLSSGIHAGAAWRVTRSTRVGMSVAVEEHDYAHDSQQGSGYGTRAGALIGWGAPWNDVVAGFVAELGVAGGSAVGEQFDLDQTKRTRVLFLSPYVAWSLVLQIPWKLPVRPIVALTSSWMPWYYGVNTAFAMAEAGLVWQAW